MPTTTPTKTYAFLVAVEVDPEKGPDLTKLNQHLRYGLQWVDGVEYVESEALGEIDIYPDPLDDPKP